jgi:hypothetical protein
MRTLFSIVGWLLELAVLGGLCAKFIYLYHNWGGGIVILAVVFPLLYLPIALIQFRELRLAHFPRIVRLRLCAVTGSCMFMSVVLFVGTSLWLTKRPSKEIAEEARQKNVPIEFLMDRYIDRFTSERLTGALLLASTSLLYASRYSANRGRDEGAESDRDA